MAYTPGPDNEEFFPDFFQYPDDDGNSSYTPSDAPARTSESWSVTDFDSNNPNLDLVGSPDNPEPSQHLVDPPTIHPYQLTSISPRREYEPPLTLNANNTPRSPPPSSTPVFPGHTIPSMPRLRRLAPASSGAATDIHLVPRPSRPEMSSSTGGSTITEPGPSTHLPQANTQAGTELECRCGTKVKTPSELRKHQRYHDRPEKCHLCDYRAGYPRDVERHMRTTHSRSADERHGPRPDSICPVCRQRFTRHDNMKRHGRRKHGGVRFD